MVRVGVVLAFIGSLLPAWRASACVAQPAALVGSPADGDSDVPTDVIPFYALLPDATTLELVTDTGEPVAFTVKETYASYFELLPAAPLAPHTAHFLRATLAVPPALAPTELALSFTTGNGPLADRPAAPRARYQRYSGPPFATLCGPQSTGACLSFALGQVLDLALLDSGGIEQEARYLLPGPAFWSLPADDGQGNPVCMNLRARGADGALSDPVKVCGNEGESYEVPDASRIRCDANGLTIDGVALGGDDASSGGSSGAVGEGGSSDDSPPEDAGQKGSHTVFTKGCGCALPGHTRGPASAWWLVLGMAALVRRRQKA